MNDPVGEMADPSLPPSVGAVLRAWVDRLREVVGDALYGVRLYGGVALGEFAPRWSDVDVGVALTRGLVPAEVEALALAQVELYERFVVHHESGWSSPQLVEGMCVSADLLRGADGRGRGWQLGAMGVVEVADAGLEPFDRLLLALHGIRILGPRLTVAPPSDRALRAQLRHDLDRLELSARPSSVWMAGMLHWAARSLAYWRDGLILPKGKALAREIGRGGPLTPAFVLGRRLRDEGPAAGAVHEAELRSIFGEAVPRILESLAPHT